MLCFIIVVDFLYAVFVASSLSDIFSLFMGQNTVAVKIVIYRSLNCTVLKISLWLWSIK